MTASFDIDVTAGPVRAINVPAFSGSQTFLQGPATLYGWSLQDTGVAVPRNAEGTQTTPAAGTTIALISSVPAGDYTLDILLQLAGTPSATDQNNFQLTGVPGGPITLVNEGVVGEYPQEPIPFNATATGAIAVKNIALATTGAIYSAEMTLTPLSDIGSLGSIQDGNSDLAVFSLGSMQADTKWLGPMGVQIYNRILLSVTQGQVQGCIYAGYQD